MNFEKIPRRKVLNQMLVAASLKKKFKEEQKGILTKPIRKNKGQKLKKTNTIAQ